MKDDTPFFIKAIIVFLYRVLIGGLIAIAVFPHTKWAKPKIEVK